jgi:hypothetical protein
MTWIIGILTSIGLPIVNKTFDYFLEKAKGDANVAIQLMQMDAAANQVRIAGMNHPIWWLGWIGFVAPYAIWVWKVVVFDKVLKLGSTDPLMGVVGEWGGVIVISIFGGATAIGITSIIFNRLTGGK